MLKFSTTSKARLATCDGDLQRLFTEVIKHTDCTIICGHRNEREQTAAFEAGNSKLAWPKSLHNRLPSRAVDVAPYPIDWNNTLRFRHFGAFVLGMAAQMGIKIRWGGDWDGDGDPSDQSFNDLVHFELID